MINYRGYTIERGGPGYVFGHEDYDDTPDAHDPRSGQATSIGECVKYIDWIIEEYPDLHDERSIIEKI